MNSKEMQAGLAAVAAMPEVDLSAAAVDGMIARCLEESAWRDNKVQKVLREAAAMLAAMRERVIPELPPGFYLTQLNECRNGFLARIASYDDDDTDFRGHGKTPCAAIQAAIKKIEERK